MEVEFGLEDNRSFLYPHYERPFVFLGMTLSTADIPEYFACLPNQRASEEILLFILLSMYRNDLFLKE